MENGRGTKRARVTRGSRNPKHGKRKHYIVHKPTSISKYVTSEYVEQGEAPIFKLFTSSLSRKYTLPIKSVTSEIGPFA
jgi:hypothetical protein